MTTLDRPKLIARDLGDPEKVTAAAPRLLVGTIYGIVSGIRSRVAEDRLGNETTYEPLIGEFEGTPATPFQHKYKEKDAGGKMVEHEITLTAITSRTLYLPAGIHERLTAVFKPPEGVSEDDFATTPIEFGVDLYAIHSTNKRGYVWEAQVVIEPVAVADPLERVRRAVAVKRAEMISARRAAAEGEAPAPAATPIAHGKKRA